MEFILQLLNATLPLQIVSIALFLFAFIVEIDNKFSADLEESDIKVNKISESPITILSLIFIVSLGVSFLDEYLPYIYLTNLLLVIASYIITRFKEFQFLAICVNCNAFLYFSLFLSAIISFIF